MTTTRRDFLAICGSAALAACGGGDLDESTILEATAKAPPRRIPFYGINGHMAWGEGIYSTLSHAEQLAMLLDLNVKFYRCDVAGWGHAHNLAKALNGPFVDSGVSILSVINPRSAGWDPYGSEAEGYALGYPLGYEIAQELQGLVTHIECGNELDCIGLHLKGDGRHTSDWNPAQWQGFRGVIHGMISGVKAIDQSIQCGVNVGIPLGFRALQMLWSGVWPDYTENGKWGAGQVRWDFTSYHWYESSYNIQRAGKVDDPIDVLAKLRDSFGVPTWLTEFGWAAQTATPESAASYTHKALTQYRSIKDEYNVETVMQYALIDERYGLIQGNGATKNPAYHTFKDFIAANP